MPLDNFSGSVAAVTGAGSGIGRELALQLAQAGCHLAIADINAAGLNETRNLLKPYPVEVSVHRVDVASREQVQDYADQAHSHHGKINLVINNAGVTVIDSVENSSYHDLEWVMNINFWGVVYGTKAFLPYLQKQSQAHIVNVSSLFGLVGVPRQCAYNASKFAVRGFTEALRQEMAGSNLGVSCVHPGGIATAIVASARHPDGSDKDAAVAGFEKLAITTAQSAAATILTGVLKNRGRILIGRDAKLVDLIARLFPQSYGRIMAWLGPKEQDIY